MALKTISNSCRFNDDDTAYLERTFGGAPTNPDKWTVSFWTKRGNLGIDSNFFEAGIDGSNRDTLRWDAADSITFINVRTTIKLITTTAVFRDPSKWYHIVCSYDSGNATVNDRFKLYVDGVQITSFSAQDALTINADSYWMSANVNRIGKRLSTATSLYDGYLSEFFSVDGSVLAATSFGEFATNGSWQPITPSVTFGTNGFQLDFVVAPGTGNGAGTDVSGNANHFTDTALAANDQHTDSPTNNIAILNPLDHGGIVLTEGNRAVTASAAAVWRHGRGTIWADSGKWYFEGKVEALTLVNELMFGWTQFPATLTDYAGSDIYGWGLQWVTAGNEIRWHNNASFTALTDTGTLAVTDVVGVAIDIDAGKMWFRYNGTWLDSGNPSAGTNPVITDTNISKFVGAPVISSNSTTNRGLVSFNSDDLAGSIPTGFKTFQTSSLDSPAIENPANHFDIVEYAGNGTNPRSFTSLNFSPDIGWIKAYDGASSHLVGDRVRGGGIVSFSATTAAESAVNSDGDISSYDAAGFTVDAGGSGDNAVNDALFNYVTYLFNEGAVPGIDVVTWTGNGSAQTLSHNLNNAPNWITAKRRDAVGSWNDYLSDVLDTSSDPEANPEQQRLIGEATTQALLAPNAWNDTLPSATQFTVGTDLSVNLATYFAYLFEQIAGFSHFGSYSGDGSADGRFLWTGFRSKFLVIKRTDVVASWVILDSSRSPINPRNKTLLRDVDSAESTANDADFLANGIKLRSSAAAINASGGEYVFMTFAEMPFKWASMFISSTTDGALTASMSVSSTATQPKAADGIITAAMSVASTGTNATVHAAGAVITTLSVAAQAASKGAVTLSMTVAATGTIVNTADGVLTLVMSAAGTMSVPDYGRLVITMVVASTATRTSLIVGTSVAIPLVAPSGTVVNSPVMNAPNVVIPLIALNGIIDNGVTAVGNLTLPIIVLDASMASDGAVVLPMPQVTATMIAGRILTSVTLLIPRIDVSGTLVQDTALSGLVQLVNVKVNGVVFVGANISASLNIPNAQLNATITTGQVLSTPVGALHSISGTRNTGAKYCP